ncbi:MAG: D-alanine--D-alanine ligase [Prevotellaceae bacterium]|jgi:D-alanine-D-alanine ligase|nr:D-alanine--D-alanine ligase [Prevotellaceae bacterium]
MSKKNIAILCGGDSSESIISVKSAYNVAGWVDKEKYNPYKIFMKGADWHLQEDGKLEVAVDKNDFSITLDGKKIKFDCALIIIHGAPGENGVLQSYFDILGVPYSTCNAFVSALTFNKFACKAFLSDQKINMAKAVLVRRDDKMNPDELVNYLGLPMFAKPNNGGSSFGVTKIKSAQDLQCAMDEAFKEDDEIIIEEFIAGTEVTCGVMILNGQEVVLPVTEVVSKNEIFDFGAKYAGQSEEITPARISPELTTLVQSTTLEIYKRLGCNGIARADYILSSNTPYFLEINTVPGMTGTSFIPQQVAAAGGAMPQVLTAVIEDTCARKR